MAVRGWDQRDLPSASEDQWCRRDQARLNRQSQPMISNVCRGSEARLSLRTVHVIEHLDTVGHRVKLPVRSTVQSDG